MTEPLDQTPLDDDVDFGDAGELAAGGNRISDARWERARSEVDARDVIFMLHDRRGNPMSCPFHGRDSKPSFYYFPENNTCFCYGCPDGDGYWDNVKVVARTLEITRPQALRWLEREFHLPPMGAEQEPVEIRAWCETCDGTGTVHGEYQRGVPVSGDPFDCPDCDGRGYWKKRCYAAPVAPADDARDAARYREWRHRFRGGECGLWNALCECHSNAEHDAAIDASMKEPK